MNIDDEKLAFKIRPEYDEADYEEVYSEPLKFTMEILEKSHDVLKTYSYKLPDSLR